MTSEEKTSAPGGEAACWAHLVCPTCGAVIGDAEHQPWCGFQDEDEAAN